MKLTKTRGVCGICGELNFYTEINCSRCGSRLVWAFLIDGQKDANFDTPLEKLFDLLFCHSNASSKAKVGCRNCDKPIEVNEKVCPHCQNWLALKPYGTVDRMPLVDPTAPEIRRLLQLKKDQN